MSPASEVMACKMKETLKTRGHLSQARTHAKVYMCKYVKELRISLKPMCNYTLNYANLCL